MLWWKGGLHLLLLLHHYPQLLGLLPPDPRAVVPKVVSPPPPPPPLHAFPSIFFIEKPNFLSPSCRREAQRLVVAPISTGGMGVLASSLFPALLRDLVALDGLDNVCFPFGKAFSH